MLALGFLLRGAAPHQADIWREYMADGVASYVHSAAGEDASAWGMQTPTVPTSWEQTLGAHMELYRAFVGDAVASHLMLVSESCLPITSHAEAEAALTGWQGTTIIGRPDISNPRQQWRKIPTHLYMACRGHEQWACVSRAHAAKLLEHEADIKTWFKECNGDNERYLATMLKYFGLWSQVRDSRARSAPWGVSGITYVNWAQSTNNQNPGVYATVDGNVIAGARKAGAYFLRKVGPQTTLNFDIQDMARPRKNPLPAAPLAAEKPFVLPEDTAAYHLASGGRQSYSAPDGFEPVAAGYTSRQVQTAFNAALAAGKEYLILLRDDVKCAPATLTALLDRLKMEPSYSAVSAAFANSTYEFMRPASGVTSVAFAELAVIAVRLPEDSARLKTGIEAIAKYLHEWGVDIGIALLLPGQVVVDGAAKVLVHRYGQTIDPKSENARMEAGLPQVLGVDYKQAIAAKGGAAPSWLLPHRA